MFSCNMCICCSSCFEVLKTYTNAVKLISHLVWFSECTEAKYRNFLSLVCICNSINRGVQEDF